MHKQDETVAWQSSRLFITDPEDWAAYGGPPGEAGRHVSF
jgi:hypothetical protein